MFAKIKDSAVSQHPYGYTELQSDNPYTNFNGADVYQAFQGTETNLAGYTLEPVVTQEPPQLDTKTQTAELADTPVFEGGQWLLKWVVKSKTAEQLTQQDADQAMTIRADRNRKLAASDWTQIADSTADKAAWATYRQALRDVTEQSGFPWTINWPTQPKE
jgi:hypothetical protein